MPEHRNISHWLLTAPGWEQAAGLMGPGGLRTLPLPEHVEIAILGAGIMGSSLAYWLTRHGRYPLVIERNPYPAGGATGRNGGLVIGGPGGDYRQAIAKLGHTAAIEIVRATEINRMLLEEVLEHEAIQAGYARTGFLSLALADEAAALQGSAEALAADGFETAWLDRAEAEKVLGTALGESIQGALYSPDEGQIHSARYTFGVAKAAVRQGAMFAFSTEVLGVEPDAGGEGWRVRTTNGEFTAGQIVTALNAWSGGIFPELDALLTPVRGHVILTEPVGFKVIPWSVNHGYEYGRQLEDGRLLVGGGRQSRADMDVNYPPPPGENVPDVAPEVVEALEKFVPQIFPQARGAGLSHHWTGVMDFSPDSHPLAGPWPGREGLWLMAGFTGHGMPYSQVLPCAIASALAGVEGPSLPRAFNPARFLRTV